VASTTLSEPLAWEHSTLLRGDLVGAVRALKAQQGLDLHVIGSPGLVQSLLVHGLIDELQLMIDPLTLGGGKRLFQDDGQLRKFQLITTETTTTGAHLATYAPLRGQ